MESTTNTKNFNKLIITFILLLVSSHSYADNKTGKEYLSLGIESAESEKKQ